MQRQKLATLLKKLEVFSEGIPRAVLW